MKAWVLDGKCRLKLSDIPKPIIGADEVLVKILSLGLCGSDIEIYRGNRTLEIPSELPILGHEAAGVIEETGEDVVALRKGDNVVLRGVWGCCAEFVKATIISPPNPRSARFIQVLKIPDDIAFGGISLLEVIPKIIMAVNRAKITPASDVLIIGQGVTGLLLTQIANLKSPHRLVAVDLFEEKLRLSMKYGATQTLCRQNQNFTRKLNEIFHDGADVIFPCHLEGNGIPEAIELLKWRGKVVLWGCLGKTDMDFFRVHAHGADILATQMDNLSEDARYCEKAIDYLQRGIIRIRELTTHTFDFKEMPQAFKLKDKPRGNVIHVLVKVAEN